MATTMTLAMEVAVATAGRLGSSSAVAAVRSAVAVRLQEGPPQDLVGVVLAVLQRPRPRVVVRALLLRGAQRLLVLLVLLQRLHPPLLPLPLLQVAL